MTKINSPLVLVIDPGVKRPELESFNRLAEHSPLTLTYHLPALFGFSSLHLVAPKRIEGIIVMGSASSVHDKLPWQIELSNFLKAHLEKKTPILGLCFGHQLIAHLHGAKVEYVFPDQKKHLGFRTVSLRKNSLWGEAQEGPLYVSHNEHVTSVPQGFEISLSSPEIPIDGLSHTSLPIWTFQPHPEATPKFLEQRENRPAMEPSQFQFGNHLVDRFLHFCKNRK